MMGELLPFIENTEGILLTFYHPGYAPRYMQHMTRLSLLVQLFGWPAVKRKSSFLTDGGCYSILPMTTLPMQQS